MFEEIDRLAAEPISDGDLQKARNQMESDFIMGLQSNVGRAFNIGMFEINTDDYNNIYEYPDRVRAVTAEDVTRVASEFLTARKRTVVTLLPEEQEAAAAGFEAE